MLHANGLQGQGEVTSGEAMGAFFQKIARTGESPGHVAPEKKHPSVISDQRVFSRKFTFHFMNLTLLLCVSGQTSISVTAGLEGPT